MYKVCVVAAGKGSRLGALTEDYPKPLIPVGNKAVLSHIIEKFDPTIEIVIAIGFKGEHIVDYLSLAYPNRKITYVTVENFDGPGSGPGLSLLACKPYLQCPFIFHAADTITTDNILAPNWDWLGVAPPKRGKFCVVKHVNGVVSKLCDGVESEGFSDVFIGIAGVHNYRAFWKALEEGQLVGGEHQVSSGFLGIKTTLKTMGLTWFDTGTPETLQATRKRFSKSLTFPKSHQHFYITNGRVIKYHQDPSITPKIINRAWALGSLVPNVESKGNFVAYDFDPSPTVYECLTPGLVVDFLKWAEEYLWVPVEPSEDRLQRLEDMYLNKTQDRIDAFLRLYGDDYPTQVNGVEVTRDIKLPEHVYNLFSPKETAFHGDLQFDNVLKTDNGFKLLDWRTDFGGNLINGERYYDLAKLYGGLTIPYHLVKKGHFTYREDDQGIWYDFPTSYQLTMCREVLEKSLSFNERYAISTIRALIFLSMAPLHEGDLGKMFFHMGRYYLAQT